MQTISAGAIDLSLTSSKGPGSSVWPCQGALPAGSGMHMQLACPGYLLLSCLSTVSAHKRDFLPVRLPQNQVVLLHVYDTLERINVFR